MTRRRLPRRLTEAQVYAWIEYHWRRDGTWGEDILYFSLVKIGLRVLMDPAHWQDHTWPIDVWCP